MSTADITLHITAKDQQWKFGDVIRVDPKQYPQVPQPDGRRWMILSFDDRNKWTILSIGNPSTGAISHWPSVTGFVKVDE